MKNLAVNIKKARNGLEWSQRDMADTLGIPIRTYQSYEALGMNHREPSNEMLLRIAEALGTSIDELLGRR